MSGGRERSEQNVTCFNTPGLYLFPRDKYDESIKDITNTSDEKVKKKRFRIATKSEFENFESQYTHDEIMPRTLRKREYVKFYGEPKQDANKSYKDIVICLWNRNRDGDFSSYTKLNEIPPHLRSCYVKLKIENNETEKEISLNYRLDNHGFKPYTDPKISIHHFSEDLRFRVRIDINDPERYTGSQEPKTFNVVAKLFQAEKNTLLKNQTLTLTLSPYEGWTLTKKGKLKQGRTGWLIDENGLYILQDGRRVDENILNSDNYSRDLMIGKEDPYKGLIEILGIDETGISSLLPIKNEYDVENDLFKVFGDKISDVVYQTFQINICYKNKNTIKNPYSINSKAVFYNIGEDETGIPIVVTRIGDENAIKKLVIAGPHGDERTAQRLIMVLQRSIIPIIVEKRKEKTDYLNDTVIYFIPCISPTMAFADARGIPVVDEKGDRLTSVEQILDNYKSNTKNIPYLHNLIATKMDIDELVKKRKITQGEAIILKNLAKKPDEEVKTLLMRTAIQTYNRNPLANDGTPNPNFPNFGIDANRDYYKSLPSSDVFFKFITTLKESHSKVLPPSAASETRQVTFNNGDIESYTPIKNFYVLMMHGYDDTQQDLKKEYGAVYGPYLVLKKGQMWPAQMAPEDKDYVKEIRGALGWSKNIVDKTFFYGNTANDAGSYQGEWSQQLREVGIWSADIELHPTLYEEGVRGDDRREYKNKYNNINNVEKILSNFINLIEKYPWKK